MTSSKDIHRCSNTSSKALSTLSSESKRLEFTDFSQAECLKYSLFLIVFTTVAVLGRGLGSSNYHVSQQIKRGLEESYFTPVFTQGEKQFKDIDQHQEIYEYMTDISLPFLLMNVDAANQPITHNNASTLQYLNLAAGQNKVLGGIRIRQLRVKEETCLVQRPDWKCYPKWSKDVESKDETISGVTWRSADALGEHWRWYGIREGYAGSGYAIDLDLNRTSAVAVIDHLKATNFIDQATRFVVQDFVAYNPTLNLHCSGRIGFELAPTGGVVSSLEVKTWRFHRYEETRGAALLAFEIIFCLFVIYFTLEEIRELRRGWSVYKRDKWNIVDVINLIFFYITIVWRIVETVKMSKIDLLPPDDHYVNFRDLSKSFEYEAYMQMVNGFLLYLKMFKYMTFSRRVQFIFSMLHRSSNDLFIFSIVLLVVFLAFGMMGFLAFSTDVSDFRSFPHSVVNLLRYTVSEPPYDQLTNSNKVLGSIYFTIWGLVMLLILANVFIAILCDSYADVTREMMEKDGNSPIFGKLFRGSVVEGLLSKVKTFRSTDLNNDGRVDADEVAQTMRVSKSCAEDMIHKFDKDNDGQLDANEYGKLLQKDRENRSDVSSIIQSIYSNNQIVPIMNGSKKETETETATLSFKIDESDIVEIEARLHLIENGMNEFLSNIQETQMEKDDRHEEEEDVAHEEERKENDQEKKENENVNDDDE